MLSLRTVGRRFETEVKVISGGSGVLRVILSEADQTQVPSYIFVPPRHIMRMRYPTLAKPGMVVQTPTGMQFIVGENGPSEKAEGVLWQSFRLFQVTHVLPWKRRGAVIDPITQLKRDTDVAQQLGNVFIAVEPTDREEDERRLATSIERARYICHAPLQADDLVGDYKVIRADNILGVTIGMLSY